MIRLLLYSRDPQLHSTIAAGLRAAGLHPAGLSASFTVAIDSSRNRVKELVSQQRFDAVLFDFDSSQASEQLAFLDELGQQGIPIVALADDDRGDVVDRIRRRGSHCCQKPLVATDVATELINAIRKAVEYATRPLGCEEKSGCAEKSGCGEMIGSTAAARAVYDLVRRVANIDAFVMITGESGTGKELIARAIHSTGNRSAEPFVAVSCGAIPESLIEAELFGCEKGAYTGALARRTGYLEQAGRGTLLLDEIGELSHHTQVKLLRVLQQREFVRLGSGDMIPLRARVLFATNRDLKAMVDGGAFREDLYYRINVVGIHSRPLRERRDDIPPLAQHFLSKYARVYGKEVNGISPDAMWLLNEHTWPGNVRELENVVQSALINTDDDTVTAAHLPEALQREAVPGTSDDLRWASFEEKLREYKTRLAMEAVEECNGNKTLAAQSLGISRTYLHRLIRDPEDGGLSVQAA
jgi:DNA-binding NtrC family response regulator